MPAIFLLSIIVNAIFAMSYSLFVWFFLMIAGAYLGTSLTLSALISRKEGWRYFGILPISFACLHFGYGIGFLNGIWNFVILRKKHNLR